MSNRKTIRERGSKSARVAPGAIYTIGYISRNKRRIPGAYKVRALEASKHGVRLVRLKPTKKNLSKLRRTNTIDAEYWNGVSVEHIVVERPLACIDMTGRKISSAASKFLTLLKKSGTRFLNPRSLRLKLSDKWRQYEFLQRAGVRTPATALMTRESLFLFLERYSVLFVKPRRASRGDGQAVLKRENGAYRISLSGTRREYIRFSANDVWRLLRKLGKSNKSYVVQQGVQVGTLDDRVFDFRVVCQRSRTGQMNVTACYIRVGPDESHQANISKKGHALDPSFVFENWRSIRSAIWEMAHSVFRTFGENLGEAGIDLVMDKRGKLYCIEINTRPGSKGFVMLKQEGSYPEGVDAIHYRNSTSRDRAKWSNWLSKFRLNPILYCVYLIESRCPTA